MALGTDEVLEAGLPLSVLKPGPTTRRHFLRYRDSNCVPVCEDVITEIRLSILIGDRELVSLMCSPWKLRELVLGFLYIEGLVESPDDIELLRICLEDRLAEVVLRDRDFTPPARRILTSGCTGGQTFGKYLEEIDRFRVASTPPVEPPLLYRLMRRLYESATLYRRSGGVHTSVLADGEQVLIAAEDIGRHNTLDKIRGTCMLDGIATRDRILISSGRISSEMIGKARKMETPIVISRTSPTVMSIRLARAWNMTLIGYVRGRQLRVYAGAERVIFG